MEVVKPEPLVVENYCCIITRRGGNRTFHFVVGDGEFREQVIETLEVYWELGESAFTSVYPVKVRGSGRDLWCCRGPLWCGIFFDCTLDSIYLDIGWQWQENN